MTGRFVGKVAIVTGGASGIGAATAARLAREGAALIIADLETPQGGEGAEAAFIRADVADPDQVAALVSAAADRFGGLDILVNNAGVGCLGEAADFDPATWERVMAINVNAIFHACRHAMPLMAARGGGAIVNVASISGLAGDYGFAAYSASKAAAINYSRTLALDGARHGIRVNVVCPGAIGDTGMGVGSHGSAADRQAWLDPIPLGRTGSAEEVANAIAFLASDEASFMTGSVVVVDGGITAHSGQPNVPAQIRRRGLEAAQ